MSFTDEDLKALKASLDTYEDNQQPCYRKREFMALLARLEAAEAVCKDYENALHPAQGTPAVIKAWRKSCGRE